jgi:hypothetical protein
MYVHLPYAMNLILYLKGLWDIISVGEPVVEWLGRLAQDQRILVSDSWSYLTTLSPHVHQCISTGLSKAAEWCERQADQTEETTSAAWPDLVYNHGDQKYTIAEEYVVVSYGAYTDA